jgi:hypothetical protein
MATKYKLVQNDTLPVVQMFLHEDGSMVPVNLSSPGTTVRMHFAYAGTKLLKETLILAKLPGTISRIDEETGAQTVKLGAPFEADGSGGRCQVEWGLTTLDTPGEFIGEVEVEFQDGRKLTDFLLQFFTVRAQIA